MNIISYMLCEFGDFLYGLASRIFSFLVLLNSDKVKVVNHLLT